MLGPCNFVRRLTLESRQSGVCLGPTGYYHDNQVPSYLIKLAWNTHCSPSCELPFVYLSQAVPPPPPPISIHIPSLQDYPHSLLALAKVGGKGRQEAWHQATSAQE